MVRLFPVVRSDIMYFNRYLLRRVLIYRAERHLLYDTALMPDICEDVMTGAGHPDRKTDMIF